MLKVCVPEIKGGECEQEGEHWRQAIQATFEVLVLLIPISLGCTAPAQVVTGAVRTPPLTYDPVTTTLTIDSDDDFRVSKPLPGW